MINSGAVELLDDEHLLRELRGLERRRGSSGIEWITARVSTTTGRRACGSGGIHRASGEHVEGDLMRVISDEDTRRRRVPVILAPTEADVVNRERQDDG